MFSKCCVILAAGEGKRMNSDIPKVLYNVLFKPMLGWVTDSVSKSGIEDICIVSGFKYEMVKRYIDSLDISCENVIQNERKGTAHALMMAKSFLNDHRGGDVLVLGGDSPFIDEKTILEAYSVHKSQNNSATIVSSNVKDPFGYGRIVRDIEENKVTAIVEEKDANEEQKKICEINSGAYWFNINDLLLKLFDISNNTSQNEYYLTSIVKLLLEEGLKVNAFTAISQEIVLGANTPTQLERLNEIARERILNNAIKNGVNIPCRDGIIISSDSIVKGGSTILPGTCILGKSIIGKGSIIGPNSQVINSKIGEEVVFTSSYCKNSNISDFKKVGPFISFVGGSENYAEVL